MHDIVLLKHMNHPMGIFLIGDCGLCFLAARRDATRMKGGKS